MGVLVIASPPECPAPADATPGNFDAATYPILATHWFGRVRPRRKFACARRLLGPGERATAQACRARGFRIIKGGRI